MTTRTDRPLDSKVVLLTGASGWLGASMAGALAAAGAHVVLAGRNKERLTALLTELEGADGQASVCVLDVTRDDDIAAAVTHIQDHHGRLDVLINNAFEVSGGGLQDVSRADFLAAVNVGLAGPFELTRACLPLMETAAAASGDASVINIASMYGHVSPDPAVYARTGQLDNPPQYGAVKAGLVQMTRWLAARVGDGGIRVNSISPGPFPKDSVSSEHPQFAQALTSKVPLGRLGSPHEVAATVVFLASPAAGFITGSDLAVDGGWTAL